MPPSAWRLGVLLGLPLLAVAGCQPAAVDPTESLLAVRELPDEQALPRLRLALEARESAVRALAAALAAEHDSTEAHAVLRRAAQDEHPDVRAAAAGGLGRLGGEWSIPILAELSTDSSPLVRQRAVQALSVSGRPSACGALEAALQDREPLIRREAARSLAAISAPGVSGDGLLTALDDDDLATRCWAIRAVGARRLEPARSTLVRLSGSDNPLERALAGEALTRLGD